MYYKITNKNSEVYKKLYELRRGEIEMSKDNIRSIEDRIGLRYDNYLGDGGQQHCDRVPQYSGFKFNEPDKVDMKIWKRHKQYNDFFVPNTRTKQGREMSNFLLNGLKQSNYSKVFDILSIERPCNFVFPFVEIYGDVIGLYLGDMQQPNNDDIIEITSKEAESLNTCNKSKGNG